MTAQLETPKDQPAISRTTAWVVIVGVGLAIWGLSVAFGRQPEPHPLGLGAIVHAEAAAKTIDRDHVSPRGWRLLAVFVPTIMGLMLRPLPGGAIVLLGLIVATIINATTLDQALAGYMHSSVWLVLAAYFISRALIKTGLARRIALTFVRLLGRRTLGLSYALVATDTVLAGMIPSNAARVGGVLLPITRSLAELYKSLPGNTAAFLGMFLMLNLYQADVVNCAMFFTGQASNPLAADEAAKAATAHGFSFQLSYGSWLFYAFVPGLVSLLVTPWLVYRLAKPTITHTPEAVEMARAELRAMGPPKFGEWVVIFVFAGVCTGWIICGLVLTGDEVSKMTCTLALAGAGVLLLSGVLTWDDCIHERGAWDVFIWYGGLVQLGTLLGRERVTKLFAVSVAGQLGGIHLLLLFLLVLLIYFYAHYGFASITAHIVSMYPAFVGVLIAAGAPPGVVLFSFAAVTNLSAGLTHYGTTPGPIIFSHGYVSQRMWWRTGLIMSVVNLAIWLSIGALWWKLLGLW
jgi:DASS family divalent anion:Na+ symporter